jgi:hypothetical protein
MIGRRVTTSEYRLCSHDVTEEMGYPWNRIDIMKDQILKPNSLQLSCNKPPILKGRVGRLVDEWDV